MKTTYYKDFCGATASITEHKDGTATLTVCINGKKKRSVHKTRNAAYQAWNRKCR